MVASNPLFQIDLQRLAVDFTGDRTCPSLSLDTSSNSPARPSGQSISLDKFAHRSPASIDLFPRAFPRWAMLTALLGNSTVRCLLMS